MRPRGSETLRRILLAGLAGLAGSFLSPAAPARASEAPRTRALAIQAGWWSVEVEHRWRNGVYAGAGVPWVAAAFLLGPTVWMVPYAGRVGYQHETGTALKLRAALHLAGTYGRENPCGDCGQLVLRAFAFAEVGLRYEAAGGFVAGLDVPVFGVAKAGRAVFPPPVSFAFAQAYLGYSWRW